MSVSALASTQPTPAQQVDDADLVQRIQHYVDSGRAPLLAAEAVIRDLCREGLAETLLVSYATQPLYEVWEQNRKAQRSSPHRVGGSQPERRVDCDALKRAGSLLESLVQVDGLWHRLGDLDRETCRQAAREQKQLALRHAHHARFLHALAERLTAGAVVRDVLDDASLETLFTEATPR